MSAVLSEIRLKEVYDVNTDYQEIIYEIAEPVATITMNRPEALNALTVRMLAEIRHAMAAAEQDERVVGIVLTGAGRGFAQAWT